MSRRTEEGKKEKEKAFKCYFHFLSVYVRSNFCLF